MSTPLNGLGGFGPQFSIGGSANVPPRSGAASSAPRTVPGLLVWVSPAPGGSGFGSSGLPVPHQLEALIYEQL